jgi:hypothetical protein
MQFKCQIRPISHRLYILSLFHETFIQMNNMSVVLEIKMQWLALVTEV